MISLEERMRQDQAHHTDRGVIAFRKRREREEAQRRKDEEEGHRRARRLYENTPRSQK